MFFYFFNFKVEIKISKSATIIIELSASPFTSIKFYNMYILQLKYKAPF